MRTKIRTTSLLAAAAAIALLTACDSTTTPAASSSAPAPSAAGSSAAGSSAAGSSGAGSSGAGSARGDGSGSAPNTLVGTTFVATAVTGSRSIVPGSTISLTIVDGERLSAQAGCNTMNGAYTITGGVLSAPLMASTMMACVGDGLMEQETWFASFLASSPTWTYGEGVLTLSNDTDTVAFSEAASNAEAIEGIGWKLTDILTVSGSTVSAVDPTLTAWIRFTAGEVAYNNSCNIGGGSAEIDDTTITFGELQSTLIFCDGPSGALETVMNSVLQGATPYELSTNPAGGRLKIMSTDGVTGLWFQADPTVGADAFASTSGSATPTSTG